MICLGKGFWLLKIECNNCFKLKLRFFVMGVLYISREQQRVSGFYRLVGDVVDKVSGVTVVYSQTMGIRDVGYHVKWVCSRKMSDKEVVKELDSL